MTITSLPDPSKSLSASCYSAGVADYSTVTYNPADITPAASSFCSGDLPIKPLSSELSSQAWVTPQQSPTLILNANLHGGSSYQGYKNEDECMMDMTGIMRHCPGLGGFAVAECMVFAYGVLTVML
ncbi:hypothetical protein MMC21_008266 [Puttea exsequens]|nr:hypothetical protein [Puttea exsequens]